VYDLPFAFKAGFKVVPLLKASLSTLYAQHIDRNTLAPGQWLLFKLKSNNIVIYRTAVQQRATISAQIESLESNALNSTCCYECFWLSSRAVTKNSIYPHFRPSRYYGRCIRICGHKYRFPTTNLGSVALDQYWLWSIILTKY
jgi:hypothetical protein